MEGQILSKLYDIGVLNSQAKLSDVDSKLTVAAFCRRRLAVIMVTSKMAETVSAVGHHLFRSTGCAILIKQLGSQVY
jgi:ribosomal protein S4